jgi:hypothetical protein
MTTTMTVLFDGEVLRPEGPVDLEPNTRYTITIQPNLVSNGAKDEAEDLWEFLERHAGSIEAPEDWSLEHDHYLYGTPKKYSQTPDEQT